MDNTAPSAEFCDVSRGLDQQSLALSGAVNTTRYEAHHKDLRSNFDSTLQSHKKQETSDALADSHAGYVTKDNPATPYSYFFEDDRREQRQNGIQMDEYEAVVDQLSGIYPAQCLSHHEKSLAHRLTDKSWLPATGASHSTRSESVARIHAQYRNETPTTPSQFRIGHVRQRAVIGGLAS